MNAIEEGQKGLYIEPVHIAINGIMDMAQSNGNKIQISSDRKDYYYKLLSKIENIDGTNKINSIIHNSLAV
ncbi:MAG: hypothetical protein J5733_05805 [Bacteroidaceae bacterium]|nr:hypothetical protein [Bacteroidaceae bacterium]